MYTKLLFFITRSIFENVVKEINNNKTLNLNLNTTNEDETSIESKLNYMYIEIGTLTGT